VTANHQAGCEEQESLGHHDGIDRFLALSLSLSIPLEPFLKDAEAECMGAFSSMRCENVEECFFGIRFSFSLNRWELGSMNFIVSSSPEVCIPLS
jgi:hypothetical protein